MKIKSLPPFINGVKCCDPSNREINARVLFFSHDDLVKKIVFNRTVKPELAEGNWLANEAIVREICLLWF